MSKRKPMNNTAGYVCSRLAGGFRRGHLMILDRQRDGDWIDADNRWLLVWTMGTFVSYTSLKKARRDMKDAATNSSADVWDLLDTATPPDSTLMDRQIWLNEGGDWVMDDAEDESNKGQVLSHPPGTKLLKMNPPDDAGST